MADKLNKREVEYIRPAVLFGWQIYIHTYTPTATWDDDPMMPVKVGKMCDSLIRRGYLETINIGRTTYIRATNKAKQLSCPTCSGRGKIFDDNDIEIGNCSRCNNGMLQQQVKGDA